MQSRRDVNLLAIGLSAALIGCAAGGAEGDGTQAGLAMGAQAAAGSPTLPGGQAGRPSASVPGGSSMNIPRPMAAAGSMAPPMPMGMMPRENPPPTAGRSAGSSDSAGMNGGPMVGAGRSAAGVGGTAGDDSGNVTGGECCADGNCLCHGPDPSMLTSRDGPFRTDSYELTTGRVYYPTDAEPPFAAVAICAGFLNTGSEMLSWGTFYASHGIVTVVTWTLPTDIPIVRASNLLAAIEELKGENQQSGSPLMGKLAGRYGTSGYSMGGGGTSIAVQTDPTLRTSVGLATWSGSGRGTTVPTLLLCGSADNVAPCSMSDSVYAAIDASVPKMQVVASGATHFSWFGPRDSGVGEYALAFQKVFLEGDERWKPLLLSEPSGFGSSMITTIE